VADPSNYYDEKGAAFILEVSPRTLRNYRKMGAIEQYRTPTGRIRYTMEQLIEFQRSIRVPICRNLPHSA